MRQQNCAYTDFHIGCWVKSFLLAVGWKVTGCVSSCTWCIHRLFCCYRYEGPLRSETQTSNAPSRLGGRNQNSKENIVKRPKLPPVWEPGKFALFLLCRHCVGDFVRLAGSLSPNNWKHWCLLQCRYQNIGNSSWSPDTHAPGIVPYSLTAFEILLCVTVELFVVGFASIDKVFGYWFTKRS